MRSYIELEFSKIYTKFDNANAKKENAKNIHAGTVYNQKIV